MKILILIIVSILTACSSHQINDTKDYHDFDVSHVDYDSPRTMDEIYQSIGYASSGIFYHFNKALRKKPHTNGAITIEFDIDINGHTSKCNILESTLDHSALQRKLLDHFCKINFGKKNPNRAYVQDTITYPFSLSSA